MGHGKVSTSIFYHPPFLPLMLVKVYICIKLLKESKDFKDLILSACDMFTYLMEKY